MIRPVKSLHGTEAVPCCNHWDHHETRPLPRLPYLVRGVETPKCACGPGSSPPRRLLSAAAGARWSYGTPLRLQPHDCRTVFATKHLNNTPVHLSQALWGHAAIGRVRVSAGLHPRPLVAEDRKGCTACTWPFMAKRACAIRRTKNGRRSQRVAACATWARTSTPSPRGEHCPKRLVCFGCILAQPKKSVA